VAGESSYLERGPTRALGVLASSVWIQQVDDRPLAQRHMLVRYSEVVAAINAAVPGANITLPAGRDPGRPPDNCLDTTRLREDTGFQPEHDVERAVPDYVDWLRGHER
jgi:hypothetical protein